jgi:alpha 1,2-mannosyltransferase
LGTEKPASAGGKTSETGQILISKRLHGQTLLLSTYYNLFGPKYYYSLLSQGAPGEGDKETFSAAADFLRVPFYQVKSEVAALGFFDVDNENEFMGGAMLQYDPIVDADSYGRTSPVEPAFIHANTPKFDPNTILEQGMTKFRSGQAHRMWFDIHQQDFHFSWGKDPERAVFEEMIVVACQDQAQYDTHKASPACYDLRKHYIDVFGVLPGRVDNVQRK